MDDFGSVKYLNVQKTGSTYISAFLEKHLKEPRVKYSKHRWVMGNYDPEAFYFSSVRDPAKQLLSLYRFGCDKSGGMFRRMRKAGLRGYYKGTEEKFNEWLDFVLRNEESARLTGPNYSLDMFALFGPQTYRFLNLSFANPKRALAKPTTFEEVRAVYDAEKIHRFVVRNEHLNADMEALVLGPLKDKVKDVDAAVAELRQPVARKNASKTEGLSVDMISPENRAVIREREKLLYDLFYQDAEQSASTD